jgi:hypothetical protein
MHGNSYVLFWYCRYDKYSKYDKYDSKYDGYKVRMT